MPKKLKTIEEIDAAIARWQTRAKRALTTLEKLRVQRKRLARKAHLADLVAHKPVVTYSKTPPPMTPALAQAVTELTRPVHPANIESAMLHGKTQSMGIVTDVPNDDDQGIPAFLQRNRAEFKADIDAAKAKDAARAAEIKAEQAERKKEKARGRIAKMKAKQAGDLKKMPLTGRAALDAIKNG